jgi:arylsulfatase A-like enzyme
VERGHADKFTRQPAPAVPGFGTKPHLVTVIMDDFGYHNVGYHGNKEIRTPTLDRLALGGVRLERHY